MTALKPSPEPSSKSNRWMESLRLRPVEWDGSLYRLVEEDGMIKCAVWSFQRRAWVLGATCEKLLRGAPATDAELSEKGVPLPYDPKSPVIDD